MRFQALQKPLGPAEGRFIPLIGFMYYAYLALKRSLGLAKQGLKSHCKLRSGQSRCRENMDLPLLTRPRRANLQSVALITAAQNKPFRSRPGAIFPADPDENMVK